MSESQWWWHPEGRYRAGGPPRFPEYRELVARYAGTGKCGHAIRKGDVIGWHLRAGAQCAECWAKWCDENAEADRLERSSGW